METTFIEKREQTLGIETTEALLPEFSTFRAGLHRPVMWYPISWPPCQASTSEVLLSSGTPDSSGPQSINTSAFDPRRAGFKCPARERRLSEETKWEMSKVCAYLQFHRDFRLLDWLENCLIRLATMHRANCHVKFQDRSRDAKAVRVQNEDSMSPQAIITMTLPYEFDSLLNLE